jgi:hypothetical protein
MISEFTLLSFSHSLYQLIPNNHNRLHAIGPEQPIQRNQPRICNVGKENYRHFHIEFGLDTCRIIVVHGTILWFDNYFLGILSKLRWDIAHAIQYYEAWLASLAIIVWYFYFMIFNSNAYPMNLAWSKGTLTEEEMPHEHPLELEQLKQQAQIQVISEEEKQSAKNTAG